MSPLSIHSTDLPPEQQAIRDKCFHPSRQFIEFRKEEIEQSIPERFEEQVRKYPDRIAVETKSNQLTYDELNKAANRVAYTMLDQEGAGNERVAFLLEQGVTAVITILGILKAGKTYVPLDPYFPQALIIDVLEDSQTSLILTDQRHLSLGRGLVRDGSRVLNVS